MDLESGALVVLLFGLALGLKHATDADHVVAVSTMASEYRNAWRGIWIGASWGLGHTTPLLIVGVIILLFKNVVLDRYESVAPYFEFGVGIMLVFLGAQVFYNLRKKRLHIHRHVEHEESPHVHIHATHDASEPADVEESHGFFQPGKPFFRMKSYLIGVIHGLAGSAAVMLFLLPKIDSFWVGVGYIILFGLGTIISMGVITIFLGVPFSISNSGGRLNRMVTSVAGGASLVFGVALMSDIAFETTLIPF